MACFLLLTVFLLFPDFKVPFFISRIACSTLFCDAFPYFLAINASHILFFSLFAFIPIKFVVQQQLIEILFRDI